jgi:thiamine-monophosphate kinase
MRSLGEFASIEAFVGEFPRLRAPFGPGDDAAVWPASRGALCLTTDAVVEGVHFRRSDGPLEDVGHKALAVNLSDLAAMGARPRWFLCALAAPGLSRAEARALGRGMAALARRYGIQLVGGNVTRASELSLTLTAAGTAVRRPLLRSGGSAGDVLYVSGTLGGARLGLTSLSGRSLRHRFLKAERRQRRPEPRVALGLVAARYASCAMDVSDGFVQDAHALLAASKVGADVEVSRLPVDPEVSQAYASPKRALRAALVGGEDYELLLGVPRRHAAAFERACQRAGEAVQAVGRLRRRRGLRLLDAEGRVMHLAVSGFDHFVAPRRRQRF